MPEQADWERIKRLAALANDDHMDVLEAIWAIHQLTTATDLDEARAYADELIADGREGSEQRD